ncbi:MAG: Phosphoglycerate mutase, partial [uncultured Nocardioides sp.]
DRAVHPGAAPPRRERVERQEPLHRLGRRRPHREGPRGGGARRPPAGRGRHPSRRRAHLAAAAGDHHRQHLPRRRGASLDPRAAQLAPQRAPLRRAPGQGQEADPGDVRRGAVHDLAPQLRRAAAADRGRGRVLPGRRGALRRPRRRPAADRVPRGRHRPDAALLGVRRDDRPARRPHRARGRARQQPPRDRQAPRRHQRRGHRRAQHPHGTAAGLRARRKPRADSAGRSLPRPGGGHRGRRRGRQPGSL